MPNPPLQQARPFARLGRMAAIAATVWGLGLVAVSAHAGSSALVLDASTGQVLNEVHADQANAPASLTKMMTLYLAFQALQNGKLKLDQQLPISMRAALKAPTKLGLRAGKTVSVRDCVLGMITKSANDAATVVGEALGGSEEHFVASMNAQALMLGMTHTRFASASGLPSPDDTTTARDIGKLAMALYRDFPAQVPYFAIKEFTFQGRLVRGHNHLMDRYPGMDGLKTGFTVAAGYNLASTAVQDGHRLFGVVLGGRTAGARDQLMAQLLDDGFEHRPTSPELVAAAGRSERSTTGRVLAALSPIGTADAEPVQRAKHAAPVKKRALIAARGSKGSAKALASARHTKSSSKLLASNAAAKCPARSSRRSACLKSAALASASQGAKTGKHARHHGRSVQVATRKRTRD